MDNHYPVYTLINECHDCYKCIRECPVKAIKIENGHASVIPENVLPAGIALKPALQMLKGSEAILLKPKI